MVELCFDVYRIFPWEWLLVPLSRSPCLWYVIEREVYHLWPTRGLFNETMISVAGCIWPGPVLCGDWMDDGWTDGPELPAFWDSDAVHHRYSSSFLSPGGVKKSLEAKIISHLLDLIMVNRKLISDDCVCVCKHRKGHRITSKGWCSFFVIW